MKIEAKIFRHWLKVFLLSLLALYIVRCFVVEPYTISSKEMETSLFKGDRVFVNKMAYGIRMPMTPFTIPFTFDNIFGLKSYSSTPQLSYRRLFTSQISRNDIVLFNNPLEKDKPIDKRSLLLSRCVGIPGDSIFVEGADFSINGKQYVASPNLMMKYSYPVDSMARLDASMKKLQINRRNVVADSMNVYLSLNRYESYLLSQELQDTLSIVRDEFFNYQLVLPAQDVSIELTSANIPLYRDIIADELDGKLIKKNGKLYVNGTEIRYYMFKENYYWFLSDNVSDAFDSRHIGFISEKHIVGKASTVWWSSGDEGIRWNRIFSKVY